jgi:hypothetical protein
MSPTKEGAPARVEYAGRRALIQTFAAKLVLEVFGGGGAIWGFSDACGLRHASNHWFWRPLAFTVACLFGVRWCFQLMDSMQVSCSSCGDVEMMDMLDNAESTALVPSPQKQHARRDDGMITPSASPRTYATTPETPDAYYASDLAYPEGMSL